MYDIGIDLGTSAVKLLLLSGDGQVVKTVSRSYPVEYPQPGWSQQNPEDWWNAILDGLPELLDGVNRLKIVGIGVAGQMHGLVALDENGQVLRPAILWNDGRTEAETDYLNNEVGTGFLLAHTGNIAFAGFTAPKLLWMQKNEPDLFAEISMVLLPKDYVNYKLTGQFTTDYSDASGTLLLDVQNKRWSKEMLNLCGLSEAQMPELHESYDIVGSLRPDTAARLGLPETVTVVAGAGDNAAAAIGTGCFHEGQCNLSLGTSGTVFLPCEKFKMDAKNAIHAFCHAAGNYHLMGCMLSAASCGKWWLENILGTADYDAALSRFSMDGENHVYFLPYLSGERSPHNDVNARGVFLGLRADTTRDQMTQAVYEGVSFALRDCLEAAAAMGVRPHTVTLCGGGAKSSVWRQLLANILNMEIQIPAVEEGPAMGGAMLAAVACGAYGSVEEAGKAILRTKETVQPDPQAAGRYAQRYALFRTLYPALKDLFPALSKY